MEFINSKNIIHGQIVDSAGHPLQGILVYNVTRSLDAYTLSEKNGNFSIGGNKGNDLKFSASGFDVKYVKYNGEDVLKIKLKGNVSILSEIKLESSFVPRKDATVSIDMKNRRYMNLGQILQGTVPGLTIQYSNSTATNVIGIDVWQQYTGSLDGNGGHVAAMYYKRMSVDEFLNSKGKTEGQRIIDGLLDGTITDPQYKLVTTTVVTKTLVPLVRGANSFTGSSNMLVVINGFPQDGFPADYPMSNVESIEVVKDPKELIKWGASASGGLIIIKTRSGKNNYLQMNYTGNFYYSPAPKYTYKKYQQSNTSDYLDYIKSYSSVYDPNYDPNAFGLKPAQALLANKYKNLISDEQFNNSWDSLSQLSNEKQLNLMQQNSFNQSHILMLTGGSVSSPIFSAVKN